MNTSGKMFINEIVELNNMYEVVGERSVQKIATPLERTDRRDRLIPYECYCIIKIGKVRNGIT